MYFKNEECTYLSTNPYAIEMSKFLVQEVYPFIISYSKYLGMSKFNFELGYDKNDDYHYEVEISVQSTNLRIGIVKYYLAKHQHYENKSVAHKNEYVFDNSSTTQFLHNGTVFNESEIEPILYSIQNIECPGGVFKSAITFYLHYCESVVKIGEEIKHTYFGGFKDLMARVNKLSMPIERTVLFEKYFYDGN